MISTAYINIWNKRVGAIAWDDYSGLASFEYEPSFRRNKCKKRFEGSDFKHTFVFIINWVFHLKPVFFFFTISRIANAFAFISNSLQLTVPTCP